MNGLLGWGCSNYPGETFLSPAPRFPHGRGQRAWLKEEVGCERRGFCQVPPLRPRSGGASRSGSTRQANCPWPCPVLPQEGTAALVPRQHSTSITLDRIQQGLEKQRCLK